MRNIKKELSRYYYVNQEIEKQTKRLKRIRKKSNQMIADTTKGSSPNFPYIQQVMKIEGIEGDLTAAAERQIDQSIAEGIEARMWVEQIIAEEKEPRQRELLRSRFVDCLTWNEVGRENNIDPSYAQRLVREWMKKHSR